MTARILVIEDNPINLELMVYALKAFGHEPISAMRGQQGIELARLHQPALIFCDVQMPEMDGYAVAKALKQDEDLRHIPLIAVTAYAMVGDREKVLAAGFDSYISKPIEPAALAKTIAEMLASRAVALARAAAGPAQPDLPVTTILVVDPKEINLSFMTSLLEPLGFRVLTARAVEPALELAHQSPPDLCIVDVGAPRDQGYALIDKIKADAQLCKTPFILVTSRHKNRVFSDRGLAAGAKRFLFRPIDPPELLAEIEACLKAARGR